MNLEEQAINPDPEVTIKVIMDYLINWKVQTDMRFDAIGNRFDALEQQNHEINNWMEEVDQ